MGIFNDIFGAIGDFSEANDYNTAAKIATQDAALAEESGRIQQTQLSRKVFQTTGQEAAATGAGNFASSGSALDVLRSTVQQGGLQHQIIGLQAGIQADSFRQQAEAYKGQAASAQAAGAGGLVNGILGIFGI